MPHRFQHETRHADLMQRQRDTQTSNAPTGNEDRSTIHGPPRISAPNTGAIALAAGARLLWAGWNCGTCGTSSRSPKNSASRARRAGCTPRSRRSASRFVSSKGTSACPAVRTHAPSRVAHDCRPAVPREAREILGRVERRAAGERAAAAAQASFGGHVSGCRREDLAGLRPLMAARLPHLHLILHSKYAVDPISDCARGAGRGIPARAGGRARLVVTEMLREPIMVVLPPRITRWQGGSAPAWTASHDLRCIPMSVGRARAPRCGRGVLSAGERPIHSVPSADNVVSHLHMVAAGLGFALLPDYVGTLLPAGRRDEARSTGIRCRRSAIVMARRRETPRPRSRRFSTSSPRARARRKDMPHLTVRARKS